MSLYEVFFDLEENLCERYHGLNPFIIRREKVGEVFLLVCRINRKNRLQKGIQKHDRTYTDSKGNLHIRREAKNDDWW